MSTFNMSAIRYMNRVGVGHNPPVEIQRKRELQTEIESKIRQLQVEYQQRLDGYEIIGNKLQRYATSVAPIQAIPSEILSDIFRRVIGGEEAHWDKQKADLATLTSVCKHWREVAIDDPLLWNRINVQMYKAPLKTYQQLNYVDLLLERSKDMLLNIAITFTYGDWSQDSIEKETNDLVRKHFTDRSSLLRMDRKMKQWIEQHVQSVPAPNCYPNIFTQVLVKLTGRNGENMSRWKSLSLALYHEESNYYLDMFTGLTPNLRSLYIDIDPDLYTVYHPLPFIQSVESLKLGQYVSLSPLRLNPQLVTSLDVYETYEWVTLVSLPSFINLKSLVYQNTDEPSSPSPEILAKLSTIRFHFPLLEFLHIPDPIPPSVFSMFDGPKLSTLVIRTDCGFPTGPMLQYPTEIIIISPLFCFVSDTDIISLIKKFLMQCTSLVVFEAWMWVKLPVLEAVQQCRATPHGLPNLEVVKINDDEIYTFEPNGKSESPVKTTFNAYITK